MYQLAKEKVRAELILQVFQYKRELELIKQIGSKMKNTFQLSFEERISKELLKEKGKPM